jgi:UDP-N-acetylmuramyl pentapeptide phosphotransferase/UDP-N-acetylglucosamine-1-phosphate transferase
MFLVGFLDDLKINIKPLTRLIIMVSLLFFIIYILPIKIFNIDIPFLIPLMSSHIFSSVFVLLCFLFVINGANLIDGFNGLLALNLIIINIILAYINMNNGNLEFAILLISQIIILLSFLLFNFPSAKIFLGDSGAYIFGALTGLNTIITNNLNPKISSFFFCTLLFYLFFEVFFSFFRKLKQKKSPIYPDEKHLHMLSFYQISSIYGKNKANYVNSIIINLLYFILIIPGIYLLNDPQLSRYWFFVLMLIYLIIYFRLYRLTKN